MKSEKKMKQPSMLKVAHEMTKGLYKANVIDEVKMREFDAMCLEPVKKIKSLSIFGD